MVGRKVIISIHDGVIQDVFCSDPETQVTLVDWGNEEVEPHTPGLVEVRINERRTEWVSVEQITPRPMADLAGTHVQRAIQAAEVADGKS
ncbi:MAG: hypothetical protein K8T91_18835 [Planctomycetes bacterium]|nr:hypothetical protein [Planctomycetota bacterium]